jgi:protein SCO1/2
MRRGFLFAGGLGFAVVLALVARSMRPRPPLPVLGQIPSFHLVDETGAPFTDAEMHGHVSVVDFVFTRCHSSCPRLTARMGELQARLAADRVDARLVSFSVDPDNDTPAVLSNYAAKAHADPRRWTFVTGAYDDVASAVVRGFKISTAKVTTGAGDDDVTHGDWFVLVDRAGAIRGYYPTEDVGDFQRLVDDTERLDRSTLQP